MDRDDRASEACDQAAPHLGLHSHGVPLESRHRPRRQISRAAFTMDACLQVDIGGHPRR